MRRPVFWLSLFVLTAASASAQSLPAAARAYLGDWTIVDDNTDESQAVIRITQIGAGIEGRIVRILPTRRFPRPTFTCTECDGDYRGVDLRTIRIIWGMEWRGDHFGGGRIVDAQNDNTYRASLRLDGVDRLSVRGYVGIPAFGRSQTWTRVR